MVHTYTKDIYYFMKTVKFEDIHYIVTLYEDTKIFNRSTKTIDWYKFAYHLCIMSLSLYVSISTK